MLAALAVLLASLSLAPAARAVVYCVPNDTIDPSCDMGQGQATIQAALSAAQGTAGVADTVRIDAGNYNEAALSYNSLNLANVVSVIGDGTGQTLLTIPNTNGMTTGLSLTAPAGSVVRDLAMTIPADAGGGSDTGIALLGGAMGQNLLVDGPAASNARGLTMAGTTSLDDSTVNLPFDDNFGVSQAGGGSPTITDSTLHAEFGVSHSGIGSTTTIDRSTIQASARGAELDSGTLEIRNSVVDLGANPGIGLDATNPNASNQPKTLNASNVTVVGGVAGSIGFRVLATAPTALQTSTGTLDSSVISGPATAIRREADNDGSPGGPSQANVTVSYSNLDASTNVDANGANGTGSITVNPPGTQTNLAPGFVNPAGDYHLTSTSPLLDIGNPADPMGALDIDGNPRGLSMTGTCAGPVAGRRDIGTDEFVPGIPASCNPLVGGSSPSTPSNVFTVGGLRGKTLTLNVPSAGAVEVTDAGAAAAVRGAATTAKKKRKPKRLLNRSSANGGPGTIEVTLNLTKLARSKLRERGKVRVSARITFTPNGGTPNSQTTKLTVKKKAKRK